MPSSPNAMRQLKETSQSDLSISGPHLASQAIEARLVDEMHLFVVPVTLGGGKAAHPGNERTDLTLLDVRRFDSGTLHLHYRFNNAASELAITSIEDAGSRTEHDDALFEVKSDR